MFSPIASLVLHPGCRPLQCLCLAHSVGLLRSMSTGCAQWGWDWLSGALTSPSFLPSLSLLVMWWTPMMWVGMIIPLSCTFTVLYSGYTRPVTITASTFFFPSITNSSLTISYTMKVHLDGGLMYNSPPLLSSFR